MYLPSKQQRFDVFRVALNDKTDRESRHDPCVSSDLGIDVTTRSLDSVVPAARHAVRVARPHIRHRRCQHVTLRHPLWRLGTAAGAAVRAGARGGLSAGMRQRVLI